MEKNVKNKRQDQILLKNKPKPIDMDIANNVMKSICKIIIKEINEADIYGTGFFMKFSDSLKCLITNYHVIFNGVINKNKNIELEIWNHKKMELNISNRYTEYLKKPKDIAIIEIKNTDNIYNEIRFLGYDSNYVNGYNIYKNSDIFTVQHPLGKNAACASGIIVDINGFEFDHNISTEPGSSGCPIILLNNNINLIQVIGIHKNGSIEENINGGTFIGEIIDHINKNTINIKNNIVGNNININNINQEKIKKLKELKKKYSNAISHANNNSSDNNNLNLKSSNKILENEIYYNDEQIAEIIRKMNIEHNSKLDLENYIIAEIYIQKDNINKEIRIINSFEERIRSKGNNFSYANKYEEKDYKNENEIKECQIIINDISIPFNYKFKFTKLGKNKIKYIFKNLLTRTDLLFYECDYLTDIDLSHFNTKNVTNMDAMFMNCTSLEYINLTNFNTKNVKIFRSMFDNCKELMEIDLTSFDTKNAINMSNMFRGCSTLLGIDLSNFNTENVIDMSGLFNNCTYLISFNTLNFNTKNVTDMSYMFNGCNSLKKFNLCNFNTKNVTNMNFMFANCKSITYLNLSSFQTSSSTKLNDIFTNSKFIKGDKILIFDNRIKQKFNDVNNSKILI